MCVLPFLCFTTSHVKALNPLDTGFVSSTQKLFISAQFFSPKRHVYLTQRSVVQGPLCCLVYPPSSKRLGACQWVLCHRDIPQCRHALCLLCYSLSVHDSLCKHLHPPTLILRTKDIKLTVNLNQSLKFTYPYSLESLSSDLVFVSDSSCSLSDQRHRVVGLDTGRCHKHLDLNIDLNKFYDWWYHSLRSQA